MRATARHAGLVASYRGTRRLAGSALCLLILAACGGADTADDADAASTTTTGAVASTTIILSVTTVPSVASTTTMPAPSTGPPTTAVAASADIACGTTTTSTVNAASAPVALTISYTCYDVVGNTPQAIRASIDTSPGRPTDPQTTTAYDAYTKWRYELNWTLATSAGACRATVSSTLTIEETFPRWVPSAGAAAATTQQWNAYLAALKVHEDGHKQIGIDTTNDAITRVSALGVASCSDFNAKAQAAIDAATSRGRQVESEYDTATGHGATQGARFP